jgi:hypothetical protein
MEGTAAAANDVQQAVGELLAGQRSVLWRLPDGRLAADAVAYRGLLSGSFHPLHRGHRALREAAQRRLEGPVCYELPVVNAEKPGLNATEVLRRLAQFDDAPVVLTAAATFVSKAVLLPRTTFVVGIDTAARIINTRFYGGDSRELNRCLETIREAGCRFLVAGRWIAGRFQTLSEIGLPPRHAGLFEELSADEFRCDLSSTELRGE